ncbi:Cytosolic carboxypeptidase-like protein 5, partial [Zootermopsis nevadensis]
DFEFNIWTKPDCAGTEFENSNRTWFYFGIKGGAPFVLVKLNIVNLNRQSKMYSQGMAPVFRTVPGRNHWDRVKEKPSYTVCTYWREMIEDDAFILSFKYRTLENIRATTFFAFTYPYSYVELQNLLNSVDARFRSSPGEFQAPNCLDDVYYHRECVCYSLEGRLIDLITISSYHNMSSERETRLRHLFPMSDVPRPFRFYGKKVVFVSARVHPGETPSSFVLNGLLNLLLARDDPLAILLRKMYVFKLIPMLNPDGVSQGHYRTDTRGVNLNRVYLNPVFELHPSVYAARSLIRYYHHGKEIEEECTMDSVIPNVDCKSNLLLSVSEIEELKYGGAVTVSSLESLSSEKQDVVRNNKEDLQHLSDTNRISNIENQVSGLSLDEKQNEYLNYFTPNTNNNLVNSKEVTTTPEDSGLFLYVDLHGHASKKGIFMYGNYFEDVEDSIECMLLPKIMSLNSQNFHFTACNFTERIMYLRDRRDGMSREGSGRVAVLKTTGLVRSYTLECNYNTGRLVNILPPCVKESKNSPAATLMVPPKYTPQVFEEVGRALGISILDLTGSNPWSRIQHSEFRTLSGIRDWLRINYLPEQNYVHKMQVQRQVKHQTCNAQCSSSKSINCTDYMIHDGTISATSCDHVFEASYCIKTIGLYGGGLGTKRFCSSLDLGNYCNYIRQPGDQLEYRSCVFTCSSDGCNLAESKRP